MLLVIAGVTGNLGKHLALSALEAGHSVRGLGRNPDKLPPSITTRLESFVQCASYYDIPAIDCALTSAEAVICAYAPDAELALDGQLILLRAAERAGIKRFHAASWNLDWSELPLGKLETYDTYISFMYQARLSSPIKPLYCFVGALAQTFFAVPGAGALEKDKAMWVRNDDGSREINVIGTGEEVFDLTLEEEAAAFSVALVTSPQAEQGGFYRFCSDSFSLKQLKEMYEHVKGGKVGWNVKMGLAQCEGIVDHLRSQALATGTLREKWGEYIGLVYAMYMVRGDMNLSSLDADKFPGVKRTSLEEYVRTNKDL